MKKILLATLLLAALSVSAQSIEVSSKDFPNIKLSITSEKKITKENVKITQKNTPIEFVIIEQEDKEQNQAVGKSIYFLVETSGFTSNAVINNFKIGLSDFVRKAPEGTSFNASSFWKANAESKILNNLSVDFTSNKDAFIEEVKQKIKPVTDSQQQADIHKAIYDAIEYIGKTSDAPQKYLIVLTAGVNKSYSPIKIEDCADKASQNSVQVFSLVYKTGYAYALDNLKKLSDKTQGKSLLVNSSKEITDALEDFLKTETAQTNSTKNYEISFTLPKSEDIEGLSISVAGKSQDIKINLPEKNEEAEPKKEGNTLSIIGGVVLVLAIIGFLAYKRQEKQKQVRQAEQDKLKTQLAQQQQQFQQEQQALQQQIQQSKQLSTQVKEEPKKEEPQKFDPKKTYIGGGGGTPTLSVSGQGFQKNFLLHKTTMTIGRKEGNDIVIPIETVSSNHATLTNEAGNWFITDNNSTNGVILNGNRVQKHILKQGDKIQLGGALLVFQL